MSAYAIAGLQSGTILTIADVLTQVGIDGKRIGAIPRLPWQNNQENTKNTAQGGSSSSSSSSSHVNAAEHYNPDRTLRWAGAGLLIHGPYFKFTFGKIDGFFANSPLNLRTVLLKTATAQFTAFPGYLALLFTYMGLAEGIRNQDELWQKVYKRVPEAFAAGCVFWPVANTFNFTFVPASYRVPYLASCGSVWGIVLSWLNARDSNQEGK
ncbi:unnamed protein product [Amoebophrya sp. A120]|nr:unnamed protein product [Amoebophrya sp. A120]|eukprot:GSA120T00020229001.1